MVRSTQRNHNKSKESSSHKQRGYETNLLKQSKSLVNDLGIKSIVTDHAYKLLIFIDYFKKGQFQRFLPPSSLK